MLDPSHQFLAGGLTDEITTDLAKIQGLKVNSRTSAQRYGATHQQPSDIARDLQIDAVVEGSIMSSGSRIRVTAQLVRAATGANLWAETYDRDAGDLFALQADIAKAIARQIGAVVARSPGSDNR